MNEYQKDDFGSLKEFDRRDLYGIGKSPGYVQAKLDIFERGRYRQLNEFQQ